MGKRPPDYLLSIMNRVQLEELPSYHYEQSELEKFTIGFEQWPQHCKSLPGAVRTLCFLAMYLFVSSILLAPHVSSADQHSVLEASERLWNGTATQMRLCLLSNQKVSPVLNGLFVSCFPAFHAPVLPSFTYFSEVGKLHLSQTPPPRIRFPASTSPTVPPPLFSSQALAILLAPSVCWLSPGEKLLHTNGMWVIPAFSPLLKGNNLPPPAFRTRNHSLNRKKAALHSSPRWLRTIPYILWNSFFPALSQAERMANQKLLC